MTRCVLNPLPTRDAVAVKENAPEILPELSASAKRINVKKLLKVPHNLTGKHPGSYGFWFVIRVMFFMANQFIFRRRESDNVLPTTGGRISVSTHINGLVDPAVILCTQKKRVIALSRHDLTTRPILGWWACRFGIQPVLRRAEIEAGVTDANQARQINDRSMMTVANCIGSGYSAIIMPEGKSHQDTRLHNLRTGSIRSAFVSAALANARGNSLPMIQPTGLHWRKHYWFRTDHYVEYGEPIKIPDVMSEEDKVKLLDGEWVEPPSKDVIELRDNLYSKLAQLGPDAPDWVTFRAWKLMAHVESINEGKPLYSLKDEVIATRKIRESFRSENNQHKLVDSAKEAAEILEQKDLDGFSVSPDLSIYRRKPLRIIKAIFGFASILILLPITLPSSGMQTCLAYFLANNTDEGLDARTSYFLLASMFSLTIIWPIVALISMIVLKTSLVSMPITFIYFLISYYLAASISLVSYDWIIDCLEDMRRTKLRKSSEGEKFTSLLLDLKEGLASLK